MALGNMYLVELELNQGIDEGFDPKFHDIIDWFRSLGKEPEYEFYRGFTVEPFGFREPKETIEFTFWDASEAVLFKLTWGGNV